MRPCELASGTMEEYSLLPQGRLFINSGESIDARSPTKRTHLSTWNAEYRPLPQKSNVFPHMRNIFFLITQKTRIISMLRFGAGLAIPIVSTMAVHANAFSIKEIKMKKIIKLLLVSIVATTLLSACANPPEAQVSEARQLIDAVIADGGQDFAPEKIASLNQRYDEALAEIKNQEAILFRNYSVAQFTLNQIMDECDDLKASIATSRGQVVAAVPKRVKYVAE